MTISLNKILTISATEFSKIANIPLDEFIPEGVEVSGLLSNPGSSSNDLEIRKRLALSIPRDAEAVVSYNAHLSYGASMGMIAYVASGTALFKKVR